MPIRDPDRATRTDVTVAVVNDSAAEIPNELAARWGITVVPMWLTVGVQAELEGTRPLDALLEQPEVLTSAPTPGEFAAAIGGCLDGADEVVVCTIAESMSATNE